VEKINEKGTSIIEAIVLIFVFAMAMTVLSIFIINTYRAYNFNLQQVVAINESRRGIETMVKEIREATWGEDGSYPIVEAGDDHFIFFSDIDQDTAVERVRYFLDGTSLKKEVLKPTGDPPQYVPGSETVLTLSTYVRNSGSIPVFKYYNGDWPQDTVNNPLPTLTRLTDTKLMHIYIVINVDPARPPDDFILESDTQIRNLKTNL
jgi:hypothetical protein